MCKSSVLKALSFAALATASAREAPSICMQSPLPTLMAGQSITASIENPQGRPCLATLVFSDENFLPISFELEPIACLGFQIANITVPLEVPNGDVTIFWECAGGAAQTCSRASIMNGLADENVLVSAQSGSVECLVPTATLTTFATSASGSTTLVSAIATTLFSTSTAPLLTNSANTPDTGSSMIVVDRTTSSSTATSSSMTTSSSTATTSSMTTSNMLPEVSTTVVQADIAFTMSTSTCSCSTPQISPSVRNNGSPF